MKIFKMGQPLYVVETPYSGCVYHHSVFLWIIFVIFRAWPSIFGVYIVCGAILPSIYVFRVKLICMLLLNNFRILYLDITSLPLHINSDFWLLRTEKELNYHLIKIWNKIDLKIWMTPLVRDLFSICCIRTELVNDV